MAEPDLLIQAMGAGATEVDGARQLFREVFGHEVSDAHWRWKYGQAANAQSLNWVAIGAQGPSRPWGHVGCRVMPGWWRGRPARLAHLTDVMVHPSLRGGLQPGSVYGRLMRAIAAALAAVPGHGPLLAWGFPGLTPARLGTRMGLYRPLQRLQLCQVNLEGSHSRPWPWAASCQVQPHHWDLAWLDQMWKRQAPRAGAESAHLHPSPAQPHDLIVQKDAAYVAWRYRDHPSNPYQLWRVQRRWWRTAGWLITRREPQALVVDALLPQGHLAGVEWSEVLQALAQASGLARWATWSLPDARHGSVQVETSLIVPVEFRASELAGGGPSPWAQNAGPAAPHAALGTASAGGPLGFQQPPWFQPGDTDVF